MSRGTPGVSPKVSPGVSPGRPKDKTKQRDEYTLVFSNEFRSKEDKQKLNALYFYKLDNRGGKLVKTIIGGEVFLKYDRENNELVYLVNTQ